jgi:hypothetical protein
VQRGEALVGDVENGVVEAESAGLGVVVVLGAIARQLDQLLFPPRRELRAPLVQERYWLAQTEKASGVVVEDVALLLLAQKRCLDQSRPDHLVRPEHDSLSKAGVDELLELTVKVLSRVCPLDPASLDIGSVVRGGGYEDLTLAMSPAPRGARAARRRRCPSPC